MTTALFSELDIDTFYFLIEGFIRNARRESRREIDRDRCRSALCSKVGVNACGAQNLELSAEGLAWIVSGGGEKGV